MSPDSSTTSRARSLRALFVLGVSMVRECESEGDAWHESMGGPRGSGIEMCMCLARSGVGGEWIRRLCLDFANPVGTRE